MCFKTIILFVAFSWISRAQNSNEPQLGASNTFYAEWAIANISANYEHMLIPWLSARTGIGTGVWPTTQRLLAMVTYHTPLADQKLEAGLGATLLVSGNSPVWHPSVTIGYRYQRASGGFFFRAGANWTFWYGYPVQVSAGYTF